jgi:glycosyltransferase involved in cell wall biosynthesis
MSETVHPPLRVCFVSSHAQLGGAEVYLELLLKALGPGWIQEVLVLGHGPLVERLKAIGVPTRVVPCEGRARLPAVALGMRRILLEASPALVHANGLRAALVCAVAATATGIPVVWHKHDSAGNGRVVRAIARRCARVVGVSAAAIASLQGARGVSTVVVPNGIPPYSVDRPSARSALLRALGAPPSARVLGLVGRLHPGKSQLEVVEMLPALRQRHPDLAAVFVGEADPHEPAYEDRVRARVRELGLTDTVSFLGQVDREEAVRVTAGCDVLLTPSREDPASGWREGCPLAPLEAMAVGTPVAGYAEPGLLELLGPCAELVPSGDLDGLRKTVTGLLGDAARCNVLRECGLQRARAHHLSDAADRMMSTFLAVGGRARSEAPAPVQV